MKVELDLSTEQLSELDKGLSNLLKTLTDEQKTEIVKEYLQNQMSNNFYKKHEGYFSNSYTELSDFGKKVMDGLQKKVAENITNNLFEDEEITKRIEDTTSRIIKNIDEIITKSLVTYIINNLFRDTNSIQYQIENTVNNMLNSRRGN